MTALVTEPLDLHAQALIFGEWVDFGPMRHVVDDFFTDVFTDVFLGRTVIRANRLPAQEIRINVGRSDEGSQVDPMDFQIELWNDDGYLTPENRVSPFWSEQPGGWGLNTPFRLLEGDDVIAWGEVSEIKALWPEGDLSDPALTEEEVRDLAAVARWRQGFANVVVTVSGIKRRLEQRTKPLRSPLTRLALYNASFPNRIAGYWPFEDGQEAIEQLRAQLPKTLIFMVSGSLDAPAIQSALAGGVHGFIVKPFKADTVLRTIRNTVISIVKKHRGE